MAGEAFESLRVGVASLLAELSGDPTALETVWISIISFSGKARTLIPLTELPDLQPPKLTLGSGTSLGAALTLLDQRMSSEVVRQSENEKGDWKPIVFLITDGEPTDTWFSIADRFCAEISGRRANVIAIACGEEVSAQTLRRITPTVLLMRDMGPNSISSFFRWISQSVRITSTRFAAGHEQAVSLPALPPTLELAPEGIELPDPRYAFLLGRCASRRALYLMRYERVPREVIRELREQRGLDLPLDRDLYAGIAAHPLDAFDFDGSTPALGLTIASDALLAAPACPHCGDKHWAKCGACAQLFCISGGGLKICPWCNDRGDYHLTDDAFDVTRGLG